MLTLRSALPALGVLRPLAGVAFLLPCAAQAPLYTPVGTQIGQDYGAAVALRGDATGDQRSDIIIGAPNDNTRGAAAGAAESATARSASTTTCFILGSSKGCRKTTRQYAPLGSAGASSNG